jgi:PfaB family protein
MNNSRSISIVGIGGIFPGARDLDQFWANILNGVNSVKEVPDGRWLLSAEEAYDSIKGAADSVYSTRGCFVEGFSPELISKELDISRALLEELDPMFHLGLYAGHQAFRDAVTEDLDLSRVGVIIGNIALPTDKSSALAREYLGRTFEEKALGESGREGARPPHPLNRYVAGLPGGVIARALGLGLGSYTLDAACASSLYALKLAVDELLSGRADAMLTGGLSRPDCLYTQMGFSQLRALSPTGICSPFAVNGDGLVVGEGSGIFVLKRTEDALRQGDHIYAVISGIGLSNDVGGSLLAPLSEGQLRAIGPAYDQAGWSHKEVDIIECHATGTPVGDAVEFESLQTFWGKDGWKTGQCVIGSVKSNIGHLLTAAGSAALMKVLLAIRNKTLPPTANFKTPHPDLKMDSSPFRVLIKAEPWKKIGDDTPRRAAISAFGFGGINAHVLIEEWNSKREDGRRTTEDGRGKPGPHIQTSDLRPQTSEVAVIGMEARFGPWHTLKKFRERVLGGKDSVKPGSRSNWWGAEGTQWFKDRGLDRFPFKGFTIDELSIPLDQYRIPPKELEEMLPQQLLMLHVVNGAIDDANLSQENRLSTGVFIGIGLDLNTTNFQLRWWLPEKAKAWSKQLGLNLSDKDIEVWIQSLREASGPPLSANRTMGALGGIVASRIAREFRIGGPAFTISSEESSGIRALDVAMRMLQNRDIDQAVVGAVDLAGDVRSVLGAHTGREFSKSGNIRPFDTRADGTITGEGASAVILKRLDHALRDGDKVYAVIKGIGGATGGGVETHIPDTKTYQTAMKRAYKDAGIEPNSVGYVETHGSGHPNEDLMESRALSGFFDNIGGHDGPPYEVPADVPIHTKQLISHCALGSVKADIGHTGAASGLASLVKVCLCLYHEILPPLRNFEQFRQMESGIENPQPVTRNSQLATRNLQPGFFFPQGPQYWMRNRAEGPRRAALSSFSVDGNCSHVILEAFEDPDKSYAITGRHKSSGPKNEALFVVEGNHVNEITEGLNRLLAHTEQSPDPDIEALAGRWWKQNRTDSQNTLAIAFVSRGREELLSQINSSIESLITSPEKRLCGNGSTSLQPFEGDRIFFSPDPTGSKGKVAFVFPGSGNHYAGMGRELSAHWPEIFQKQDSENDYLFSQFLPDLFWNTDSVDAIDRDPKSAILGQVALGTVISDLIRGFGVRPDSAIGYSLGESAALFSLGFWTDRDAMLARMNSSRLFTDDLAGPCNAARKAWSLSDNEEVDWVLGVINRTEDIVRKALKGRRRVYLLIVNTPEECLVGGNRMAVEELVEALGCRFFPLSGVTTVHCEIVRQVEKAYRDLHLFETTPPAGIRFYSSAWGRSYEVNRESAADSILAQALDGINFPEAINAAYKDGVRIFLEMGPGNSCTRMIRNILQDRPHVARAACFSGQDPVSTVLRLLGQLIAERVPVDLNSLYGEEALTIQEHKTGKSLSLEVQIGGRPFQVPVPEKKEPEIIKRRKALGARHKAPSMQSAIRGVEAAAKARAKAHEAYLKFSQNITHTISENLKLQMSLLEAMKSDSGKDKGPPPSETDIPFAFDRAMCMEFATGSVAKMLGPEFAPIDNHPTRVRLPDEPLMLVDRIVSVQGEPRSMKNGRVITEHDIHPGAWYLDGGRIPTCITVEAGQADLFLSGYLGIDFKTKGLAVYRLLDAVVTFHRELPGPGSVIRYDIRIEHFFRQGDTYLFKFSFEGSVDGEPLLTMKDGCAGFFTSKELAEGKGITHTELDRRPVPGVRPEDWEEFVPMSVETYDDRQIADLRSGDLEACFGSLFKGLDLKNPLCIPTGRMKLVDRVLNLDPEGGRFGMGIIRAEADIHADDWFLKCHFVDDRVMPGTLMYECCLHTLRIFLLRMGWVDEQDEVVLSLMPGVAARLKCRGQVIETTQKVVYEVSIKEVGYGPEPYAIADALIFADGKPIVEITDMSIRFSGLTRERIRGMWEGRGRRTEDRGRTTEDTGQRAEGGRQKAEDRTWKSEKSNSQLATRNPQPLFDHDRILAFAVGKPSEAFGEPYKIFDHERVIARLPGPPYQFLNRIMEINAEPWKMSAGGVIKAQYDVPPEAWYFKGDEMPFAILLEVALQPCGWFAAYMGTALTSEIDLSFRNLGGTAVQYEPLYPGAGTLTTTVKITKVSSTGGMIIHDYEFVVRKDDRIVYEGDTYFGFFSKQTLSNQVGIRDAEPYEPAPDEIERGLKFDYPDTPPFSAGQLRMVDNVDLFDPDGGPNGLGFIRGTKKVDSEEWFFKAHFYQDPVWPGSLGLESFLQLIKIIAVNRWGNGLQIGTPAFQPPTSDFGLLTTATGMKHSWIYRGQVIPSNRLVTAEASISSIDDDNRLIRADGLLTADGRVIYQMNDFTLKIDMAAKRRKTHKK